MPQCPVLSQALRGRDLPRPPGRTSLRRLLQNQATSRSVGADVRAVKSRLDCSILEQTMRQRQHAGPLHGTILKGFVLRPGARPCAEQRVQRALKARRQTGIIDDKELPDCSMRNAVREYKVKNGTIQNWLIVGCFRFRLCRRVSMMRLLRGNVSAVGYSGFQSQASE